MTMTRTNRRQIVLQHLSSRQRSEIRSRLAAAREKCKDLIPGVQQADFSPLSREVLILAEHYGVGVGTIAWANQPMHQVWP